MERSNLRANTPLVFLNSPLDWQSTSLPIQTKPSLDLVFLTLLFFFQNTSAYIQKKEKHLQGGSYCGVAEKAECDHGQGRGEDGAKHNAGHQAVDQSNDQILCGDQHWTRPAVQRAP